MFIFASGMARLRSDPQQTLFSASPVDFTRLGVSPDSVARFLHLADSLGVPLYSVPGSDTRASNNLSGLVRFDWVLSNSHTLTLRGNWNGTSQNPSRLGPLSLPQTGGDVKNSGGGLMATVTSHFGATVLNELRGFYQGATNRGDPFSLVPQARVQVASVLPDTTLGITTLSFGGNAGLPVSTVSSGFEASNELSWLPGAGSHRFKVGADWLTERTDNLIGGDQYGTFLYNSLGALATDSAASYRRTLGIIERRSYDQQWGRLRGRRVDGHPAVPADLRPAPGGLVVRRPAGLQPRRGLDLRVAHRPPAHRDAPQSPRRVHLDLRQRAGRRVPRLPARHLGRTRRRGRVP